MGYTVLARRYRSRDFDEVVGQEPIARTLTNAVSSGRVAHAYLFCGTRGVGKTTMARLLARELNVTEELVERDAISDAIMRGEALCNIIRHGYDSRPDGRIRVSIHELDESDRLEFVIEDDARQVDLDTIRSRELDDVRPGGLGVHLINEIMEDVRYEHREGGGMRIRMHKRLPDTGAPVDAGEAEPCK